MKKKLPILSRYLLGFVFFAFGLAGLLNLLPMPENLPEKMMSFNQGLMASGYFFPFLKGVETICGLMLLTGFYPALALVILAPITINILLVHLFLTPGLENLIMPVALLILQASAVSSYWQHYQPILQRKPKTES